MEVLPVLLDVFLGVVLGAGVVLGVLLYVVLGVRANVERLELEALSWRPGTGRLGFHRLVMMVVMNLG